MVTVQGLSSDPSSFSLSVYQAKSRAVLLCAGVKSSVLGCGLNVIRNNILVGGAVSRNSCPSLASFSPAHHFGAERRHAGKARGLSTPSRAAGPCALPGEGRGFRGQQKSAPRNFLEEPSVGGRLGGLTLGVARGRRELESAVTGRVPKAWRSRTRRAAVGSAGSRSPELCR